MVAPPTEHEILDVNRRYHDVAADTYDGKWGISFGEIGHQQVLGKLTKLLGPAPGPFARSLEIGAGTGYFSLNLLQTGVVRDATCTDISPGMLAALEHNAQELGLEIETAACDAAQLPFKDESFDLVLSEYGASIWADPYAWIPEAARLLRPGGELVFLVNGVLLLLCLPDEQEEQEAGERLLRPYFGMHRFEWRSDDSVNFQLGYGDWIRLLRAHGFEVEDLIEVQAPPDAAPTRFKLATPAWAQRWPSEEIWKARKRA
jgi:ubiquinone/menaquinone biosynthesis C-methylase UbiE